MNRITYQISGRLVKIVLEGENPGDAILATFRTIFNEIGGGQPCLMLVDAREAETSRPTSEVRSIATRFTRMSPLVERLAVVTASDFHHGLARVALSVSETDEVKATVCRTMSEAYQFLGVDPTGSLPVDQPRMAKQTPQQKPLTEPPVH